eukprot:CAMPEP_0182452056 /NCGR_PEP_ID=MMETSP1172-20130603/44051_1 /TAXON_ID=708627 /ORGANISM="Timspurckia oligopyrenoides, Strain CCMP3278" /LENGTH=218 /DNA_ID=CAMNT_0024649871 /DNA_START=402 /DNA_END=1058 /DNA_ORIENTATION=-
MLIPESFQSSFHYYLSLKKLMEELYTFRVESDPIQEEILMKRKRQYTIPGEKVDHWLIGLMNVSVVNTQVENSSAFRASSFSENRNSVIEQIIEKCRQSEVIFNTCFESLRAEKSGFRIRLRNQFIKRVFCDATNNKSLSQMEIFVDMLRNVDDSETLKSISGIRDDSCDGYSFGSSEWTMLRAESVISVLKKDNATRRECDFCIEESENLCKFEWNP